MDNDHLSDLLRKYQENSCTPEELQELEQWYESLDINNLPVMDPQAAALANEMLAQFRSKLVHRQRTVPLYHKTFFRVAVAAAAAAILFIAVLFVIPKHSKQPELATNKQQPLDITPPNSTKAYITLSDGTRIYLDSLQNGRVAKEGNVTINKQGDKIIYEDSGLVTHGLSRQSGSSQVTAPDLRLNTITVPRGSKPVKLLLADNSEMWLDAATTVTYPNAFVGTQRKVEIITGQAYFEVTHNASMPFIVKKGNAEVEVLGTHFNVSAFDGEAMKVTLLQGSVKVSDLTTHESKLIQPGQQAQLTTNGRLLTDDNVDLDEVMAWKEGNFQFDGTDISSVMKQLARWYDVDVTIEGTIPDHFGGTISRDVNVSQVFHMLQLTGAVNYKIKGKKIIVTP